MILLDNILCPAHDVTVNLRKYMMITTVATPKLIDLLDMILMQNHTERTREQIRELKDNCKACISDCRKTASAFNKISPDILRMTVSLYALWDNITVAAPIKEKVQIWESCYAIALQQKAGIAPYQIDVSACARSRAEYIELSKENICDELLDYAGEIEAWLDEYFSEEYDEYSTDEEYDMFVKIQVGLEFLAEILSDEDVE